MFFCVIDTVQTTSTLPCSQKHNQTLLNTTMFHTCRLRTSHTSYTWPQSHYVSKWLDFIFWNTVIAFLEQNPGFWHLLGKSILFDPCSKRFTIYQLFWPIWVMKTGFIWLENFVKRFEWFILYKDSLLQRLNILSFFFSDHWDRIKQQLCEKNGGVKTGASQSTEDLLNYMHICCGIIWHNVYKPV